MQTNDMNLNDDNLCAMLKWIIYGVVYSHSHSHCIVVGKWNYATEIYAKTECNYRFSSLQNVLMASA